MFAAVTLLSLTLHSASAATLGWNASTSANIVGYTLRYGLASGSYPSTFNAGTALTATISTLAAGTKYYFVVTARNASGVESDLSNEISLTTSGIGLPNALPTLNALGNVTINEDSAQQTVSLTGITAGVGDLLQVLGITAVSSNPGLIPNPTVAYASPNATGTLGFTPVANANGAATITVTVNDSQLLNNLFSRTFTVTVNPVNDAPTLNTLNNLALGISAARQTVPLAGIGSGAANESQALTVTATSSNPSLIPTPTVTYTSPGATGSLAFTPTAGVTGTATITVSVNDGQSLNNIVSRSFTVTVSGTSVQTIYVEAETGTRVSPMTVASDTAAANGQYVYSPSANLGTVSIPVNIPQAGNYTVWCRVLSPDNGRDSLFVQMDGGVEEIYQTALNTWSASWQWSKVNSSGAARTYALSQGTHTLVFRSREASTFLDALYVSNDPGFVPGTAAALAFSAAGETDAGLDESEFIAASLPAGLVVSELEVVSADARTINLSWRTREPSSSRVEYGITTALENSSLLETNYSTAHTISLTRLLPGTAYLIRVQCIDAAGNVSLTEIGQTTTPLENAFAWAAEDGTLVPPMKARVNARAMGRAYISSPVNGRGSALFPIQVEVTSDYVLWCRVWLPIRGTGSFRVALDGGNEVVFRAEGSGSSNAWRWVRASDKPFQLDAGRHQFTFNLLGAGMWLDDLALSNDPEWTPED